jgi:hypothetical protein
MRLEQQKRLFQVRRLPSGAILTFLHLPLMPPLLLSDRFEIRAESEVERSSEDKRVNNPETVARRPYPQVFFCLAAKLSNSILL